MDLPFAPLLSCNVGLSNIHASPKVDNRAKHSKDFASAGKIQAGFYLLISSKYSWYPPITLKVSSKPSWKLSTDAIAQLPRAMLFDLRCETLEYLVALIRQQLKHRLDEQNLSSVECGFCDVRVFKSTTTGFGSKRRPWFTSLSSPHILFVSTQSSRKPNWQGCPSHQQLSIASFSSLRPRHPFHKQNIAHCPMLGG